MDISPHLTHAPTLIAVNTVACVVLLTHAICALSITQRKWRDPLLAIYVLLVGGCLGALIAPLYGFGASPPHEVALNLAGALAVLYLWWQRRKADEDCCENFPRTAALLERVRGWKEAVCNWIPSSWVSLAQRWWLRLRRAGALLAGATVLRWSGSAGRLRSRWLIGCARLAERLRQPKQ